MFAHIPEKGQHVHVRSPVEVIHHQCRVIALEIYELAHLGPEFVHPTGHNLRRVEIAFCCLEAGVPDQAGGATHQCYRAMARELETPQHQKRHQRANMQAVSGRIEAAVQGLRSAFQPLFQGIFPGNLEYETSRAQVSEKRTGHRAFTI